MRLSLKNLVTVALIATIFQACNIHMGSKPISEGVMKYNITYLEDENQNPIISLMPSQLKMSFKSSSVVMEVEGWMGVFKSSFIKNGPKNEAITLLKMLNKKYCYRSKGSQGFLGFSAYEKINIDFDTQTKEILKYTCKHAKVTLPEKKLSFDIYYTDEIKIDRPNEFTPYAQINGVLLEFQIEINGIPMHLIASEIVESTLSDDIFEAPADYENVPREELDKIFSSII